MEIESFKRSPVGRLVPISGHDAYLQRSYSHFAFVPCPPPSRLDLSQGTYNAVPKAHLRVPHVRDIVLRP